MMGFAMERASDSSHTISAASRSARTRMFIQNATSVLKNSADLIPQFTRVQIWLRHSRPASLQPSILMLFGPSIKRLASKVLPSLGE